MAQRVYQHWAQSLQMRWIDAQDKAYVNKDALLEEAAELGRQSPLAMATVTELANTIGLPNDPLRIAFTRGVQQVVPKLLNEQKSQFALFIRKETGPALAAA